MFVDYILQLFVSTDVLTVLIIIRTNISAEKKLTQEIKKEESLSDMGHKKTGSETGEDPVNIPIEYVLESIKTIYSIKHKNRCDPS